MLLIIILFLANILFWSIWPKVLIQYCAVPSFFALTLQTRTRSPRACYRLITPTFYRTEQPRRERFDPPLLSMLCNRNPDDSEGRCVGTVHHAQVPGNEVNIPRKQENHWS
ncbi:hypothetical protein OE88DRAFT_312082 [Heliocybe sulcata]|uniref:Uncharacterized protein n=1 Tax=Heliocybe sulcata TaxID=5364 RepID=A0A5C3MYV6_9AGAM|nr:hypothetical protein OE88DRAFT_312082 [Heliocybe sulcata]